MKWLAEVTLRRCGRIDRYVRTNHAAATAGATLWQASEVQCSCFGGARAFE